MKVFLGWSGDTSKKVATALHDWLPKVIQSVRPYVSSEDIAKGARWSSEISKELQSSNYGIICITRENLASTWIHFEAGALSREIEKSFVTPFLFNLKVTDIQGPLQQFQTTLNEKDDVLKMIKSINANNDPQLKLDIATLEESFGVRWAKLHEVFAQIAGEEPATHTLRQRREIDVLEELLARFLARERYDEGVRDWMARELTALRAQLVQTINGIAARFDLLEQRSHSAMYAQAPAAEPSARNAFADLLVRSSTPTSELRPLSDLMGPTPKLPDEK
jgi:hypothetical protein